MPSNIRVLDLYVLTFQTCDPVDAVVEEEESVGLDREEGSEGELHEEEGENDLVVLDPTHVSKVVLYTHSMH